MKETLNFNGLNFIFDSRVEDKETGRINDLYCLQGENERNWSQCINVFFDTIKKTNLEELEFIRKKSIEGMTGRGVTLIHDFTTYSKDEASPKPVHVSVFLYPFPNQPQLDIGKKFINEQNYLYIVSYSIKINPDEVQKYSTESIELSSKLLDLKV